jgi:hypothetical protein
MIIYLLLQQLSLLLILNNQFVYLWLFYLHSEFFFVSTFARYLITDMSHK